MTILNGTDFSPSSLALVGAAAAMARSDDELLVLAHFTDGARDIDAPLDALMAAEKRRLDCNVRTIVARGAPTGARFAELARETNARLVVVGAQGASGRQPLGSVAAHVIRAMQDVPLLVGRQPGRLLKANLRVLWSIALDDSDAATLASLAHLARTRSVTLDVMHARALPQEAHSRREATQLAERDVRERLASLPPNVTLRHVLVSDGAVPIHEAIARAAVAGDTDLIVCGSHHRRGLERAVEGSVAERIVQHAPVSVQVAPV